MIYDTNKMDRIIGYTLRTLEGVKIVVSGTPDDGFIYKGFIFTPVGVMKFDTDTLMYYTKREANAIISGWKETRKTTAIDMHGLIANWKQHGLRNYRWYETLLMTRWSDDK